MHILKALINILENVKNQTPNPVIFYILKSTIKKNAPLHAKEVRIAWRLTSSRTAAVCTRLKVFSEREPRVASKSAIPKCEARLAISKWVAQALVMAKNVPVLN